MKQCYTALLLTLFVASIAHGQPKIKGLGIYKVGITTADSIVKNHDSDYFREINKGDDDGPGCGVVRKFISYEKEIGGVTINNIELWFYADRLYKIKCDYSESLRDAMLDKYGSGVIVKSSTSQVRCVYKLTGRTSDVFANKILRKKWTNGRLEATLNYSLTYDSDCKPHDNSYLQIIDAPVQSSALSCEVSGIRKEFNQEEKIRREKLKDF